MEKTLFDKYGGFSAVSRIVLSLYDTLLDDDDVGPFFDDVDMPKLIDHQTKFLSSLLGGPASFTDDHLMRAHRHLAVADPHFDRLKEIVSDTLARFDVDPADIDVVLDAFEQRRSLIVKAEHVD